MKIGLALPLLKGQSAISSPDRPGPLTEMQVGIHLIEGKQVSMQEAILSPVLTEADEDKPPGTSSLNTQISLHDPRQILAVPSPKPLPNKRSWCDWRWQMRHRIRSLSELSQTFPSLAFSEDISTAARVFPMAITPYYASLIENAGPDDPVFRMAVPDPAELIDPPYLENDPLAEDHDMPVPGLVHRYADRALLLVTTACAMYCRHCTRKRVAGQTEGCLPAANLAKAEKYLRAHPEIRDVIVSGGDPFTMATSALERVLSVLRRIDSIDIIRIGTRTPVTLPMRITDELTAMLRKYHPIWVNTHFNHPNEITPEAREACLRLVDAGIPMGNQTVLLRGINDDPATMETLCRSLVRMRVRPYYIFQCDLVRGVEHFRTPLSRGIEIMEYLRGRLSGLAIPTFVVDAPGGGGKIPILPNYIVSLSPTHTVLRNFRGTMVSYPEPAGNESACTNTQTSAAGTTVWDLAAGRETSIEPHSGTRGEHRHDGLPGCGRHLP